jgi:hypothetical protein
MAFQHTLKWLILGLASLTLCSCLGGTITQQMVQAMLIQGADKATEVAIEDQDKNQTLVAHKMSLNNTPPDKYDVAFANAAFNEVTLQVEPLPETPLDEEKPLMPQEAKLVLVEVWSLLIGDEKKHVLENAKKLGSSLVPPENEWQQSQIAIGATSNKHILNSTQKVITFLIPAEVGKLHSGSKALVELATAGQLSVARYSVY